LGKVGKMWFLLGFFGKSNDFRNYILRGHEELGKNIIVNNGYTWYIIWYNGV